MPQTEIRSIPLDSLRLDGDTQPRETLDSQTVDAYATDLEGGAELPVVDAFFDKTNYWLADGFHRHGAHEQAKKDPIKCRIHLGTVEDARWFALAANKIHGLRRSNTDKARAVKRALTHPNGAAMSDNAIAEHVGVSHATVIKYRAELESTCQIDKSDPRTGRDGRTINTANIGAKPAKPESVDESEPERFCPKCDGALGRCGCVKESPVVDEEGPPDAPEPDPAPADSEAYLAALGEVMAVLDDHQPRLTPEGWNRLQNRVIAHFRLFGAESLARVDDAVAPNEQPPVIPTKKGDKARRNKAAKMDKPDELCRWCEWWNELQDDGLAKTRVKPDEPNKATIKAWKRSQRDTEARDALTDRAALRKAFEDTPFAQGRFTLPQLLGGRNKDGELIAQRLLNGEYDEPNRHRKNTRAFRGDDSPARVKLDDAEQWPEPDFVTESAGPANLTDAPTANGQG